MSISKTIKKINTGYLFAILAILLALLLTTLYQLQTTFVTKKPLSVDTSHIIEEKPEEAKPGEVLGAVVASKTGKKYHLPDCPGAKTISEKNKITFESVKAAEAAGYAPASTCKALSGLVK